LKKYCNTLSFALNINFVYFLSFQGLIVSFKIRKKHLWLCGTCLLSIFSLNTDLAASGRKAAPVSRVDDEGGAAVGAGGRASSTALVPMMGHSSALATPQKPTCLEEQLAMDAMELIHAPLVEGLPTHKSLMSQLLTKMRDYASAFRIPHERGAKIEPIWNDMVKLVRILKAGDGTLTFDDIQKNINHLLKKSEEAYYNVQDDSDGYPLFYADVSKIFLYFWHDHSLFVTIHKALETFKSVSKEGMGGFLGFKEVYANEVKGFNCVVRQMEYLAGTYDARWRPSPETMRLLEIANTFIRPEIHEDPAVCLEISRMPYKREARLLTGLPLFTEEDAFVEHARSHLVPTVEVPFVRDPKRVATNSNLAHEILLRGKVTLATRGIDITVINAILTAWPKITGKKKSDDEMLEHFMKVQEKAMEVQKAKLLKSGTLSVSQKRGLVGVTVPKPVKDTATLAKQAAIANTTATALTAEAEAAEEAAQAAAERAEHNRRKHAARRAKEQAAKKAEQEAREAQAKQEAEKAAAAAEIARLQAAVKSAKERAARAEFEAAEKVRSVEDAAAGILDTTQVSAAREAADAVAKAKAQADVAIATAKAEAEAMRAREAAAVRALQAAKKKNAAAGQQLLDAMHKAAQKATAAERAKAEFQAMQANTSGALKVADAMRAEARAVTQAAERAKADAEAMLAIAAAEVEAAKRATTEAAAAMQRADAEVEAARIAKEDAARAIAVTQAQAAHAIAMTQAEAADAIKGAVVAGGALAVMRHAQGVAEGACGAAVTIGQALAPTREHIAAANAAGLQLAGVFLRISGGGVLPDPVHVGFRRQNQSAPQFMPVPGGAVAALTHQAALSDVEATPAPAAPLTAGQEILQRVLGSVRKATP
jgi:hypothetical protein